MAHDFHRFVADLEQPASSSASQSRPRARDRGELRPRREAGGPALLFERVKGRPFPVLINSFRTDARMALALGRPPAEIGQALMGLVKTRPPRSLREAMMLLQTGRDPLDVPPKMVRRARCQDVVLTRVRDGEGEGPHLPGHGTR